MPCDFLARSCGHWWSIIVRVVTNSVASHHTIRQILKTLPVNDVKTYSLVTKSIKFLEKPAPPHLGPLRNSVSVDQFVGTVLQVVW